VTRNARSARPLDVAVTLPHILNRLDGPAGKSAPIVFQGPPQFGDSLDGCTKANGDGRRVIGDKTLAACDSA